MPDITTLRCDAVNPRLLGMKKVVSEDAVRRGLAKIDEAAGLTWLQTHLDYCVRPLLSEPWVLTPIARSSRYMGIRKARCWVTTRTNRGGRRTATTPT